MGKISERLKDSVVFTEEGVLLFICSYFNQGHILTGVDSLMGVIWSTVILPTSPKIPTITYKKIKNKKGPTAYLGINNKIQKVKIRETSNWGKNAAKRKVDSSQSHDLDTNCTCVRSAT